MRTHARARITAAKIVKIFDIRKKNQKKDTFLIKKCKNICVFQKKAVPLHPLFAKW